MSIGDDISAAINAMAGADKMVPSKVWDVIAPLLAGNFPWQSVFTTGDSGLREFDDVWGFKDTGNPTTGTLKITLPFSWTNTMMTLLIEGGNYAGTTEYGAWSLLLGGYNNTGPSWYGATARLVGQAPFTQVRWGHDGTKCCILLGTTSTTWAYLHAVLKHLMVTYAGADDGWGTGWSVSIISSESGITVTQTISTIGAGYAFYAG